VAGVSKQQQLQLQQPPRPEGSQSQARSFFPPSFLVPLNSPRLDPPTPAPPAPSNQVSKIGDASAKDAAQAAWALASAGRADKPALDALGKALGAKLGAGDAPADAAAALWAFATLNHKLDGHVRGQGAGLAWRRWARTGAGSTLGPAAAARGRPAQADPLASSPEPAPPAQALTKAAAAVKAGVADLSPEQAIHGAWALALLGGDKDAVGALLGAAGAAVAAAPDCVSVQVRRGGGLP
jgi:hypothetical protein